MVISQATMPMVLLPEGGKRERGGGVSSERKEGDAVRERISEVKVNEFPTERRADK